MGLMEAMDRITDQQMLFGMLFLLVIVWVIDYFVKKR